MGEGAGRSAYDTRLWPASLTLPTDPLTTVPASLTWNMDDVAGTDVVSCSLLSTCRNTHPR